MTGFVDFQTGLLWPEILMLLVIVGVMCVDMSLPRERRGGLLLLSAVGVGAIFLAMLALGRPEGEGMALNGQWIVDPYAWVVKLFLLGVLLTVLLVTAPWTGHMRTLLGEHLILVLASGLGMLIMVSANDLALLFVGLELATIPLMILTALDRRRPDANEAAIKFLIAGSVASAFTIFGIALIWGYSGGELLLTELRAIVAAGDVPVAMVVGVMLLFAGLGFKTAIAPFHAWVPDVYEGAPTPITAFLAGGSKAAGFAALVRVGVSLFGAQAEAIDWATLLAFLAGLTAILGNMAAMWQRNLKRLLAHASVGHAGFLLMGLAVVGTQAGTLGLTVLFYYLIFYAVAVAAVFFAMGLVSRAGEGESLADYEGLGRRAPLLALGLFLGVLSMGGIPPMAGFTGKILIVATTWQGQMPWLAAAAVFGIVLSIVYTLMILRTIYVTPQRAGAAPIPIARWEAGVLIGLGVVMLIFGAFPAPVMSALEPAMANLVGGTSELLVAATP